MSLLEIACAYKERGYSLVAIKPETKEPIGQWAKYRERQPTLTELGDWFEGHDNRGLAIVTGEVSNNVVVRDFDDEQSFQSWQSDNPTLAAKLPTVKTRRGAHVYFRSDVGELRRIAGRPNACRIDDVDGELHFGSYVMLPPSVHPTGFRYQWLQGNLLDDVPFVPVKKAAGLVPARTANAVRTHRVNTPNQTLPSCVPLSIDNEVRITPEIELAIELSAVQKRGTRNKCQLQLCQRLKAIPGLSAEPGERFGSVVYRWWDLSKGHCKASWNEAWRKFLAAWPTVLHPMIGLSRLTGQLHLPAAAKRYKKEQRRLLQMCRELAVANNNGPFFFSARDAASLLDVGASTASRYFRDFETDCVLQRVFTGSFVDLRANEFLYLGD